MAESNSGELKESKEGQPRGPVRALVVEDEEQAIFIIKGVIDEVGDIEASHVDSASEALSLLRKAKEKGEPIEFVFSDLGLTDDKEGGFKIVEAVRGEELAGYFILFTGSAGSIREEFTQEQLRNKGINELIEKPASTNALIESFNRAKQTILKPPQNK